MMPGPHGRRRRGQEPGEDEEREAQSTAAPRPGPEALERYRRWRWLLEEGVYPSQAALARAEGVSPAAVSTGLGRLEAVEREGWRRGT